MMLIKRLEKRLLKQLKKDYPWANDIWINVNYSVDDIEGIFTTLDVSYGWVHDKEVFHNTIELFYSGKKSITFIEGMFYQAVNIYEKE